MKRKLIASIVGIAATSAMVASSYGQGQITFANYAQGESGTTASPSAPVTFGAGSGGLTGTAVGSNVGSGFSAELLYQYAGMSGGIASPVAGFNIAQDGANAAVASFYPASAGGLFIFSGGNGSLVTIPGDPTGGPIVTFELYVFGTVNSTSYVGTSSTFQQVLSNPVGDLFNNGNLTAGSFLTAVGNVGPVVVPEPTTMALAGLGVASLLALRRRK